ncbi:MAG: DUF4397 domain-containing protein [Gemmatimonadota bacterium]
MNYPTRAAAARVLRVAFLAGVAACGTTEAPSGLSPEGEQGRIRFVNLITDTTRGRVNAILEQIPFGVNLTYTLATPATLAAPNTAPYAPVLVGDRTLVLKRTADTTVTVASFTLAITRGDDRTVYATGGAGGSGITAHVTSDDNTAASATQTRFRVVQMSPTAGNVDVFVTAVGADLGLATPFATLAYRGASSYSLLAPGNYQVRMVPAGTAPASRAGSVSVNLATVTLAGGTGRTVVSADNNIGGSPLRAFVLSDR